MTALPHNLDAEASILGGILLKPELLARLDELEVADFFDNKNKVVFAAMRNLVAAGRPIDVVTLEAEIEKSGKLEAIGGVGYLGELSLRVPTADNVSAYADDVIEAADNRVGIERLDVGARRAREWPHTAAELLEEVAGELLHDIRRRGRRAAGAGGSLLDAVPQLARNRQRPIFKTGLAHVDRLAPLMGGQLLVLIGGKGSGKSTLALQIAQHHAAELGPSLIVSLELSREELAARLVARAFNVPWFGALRGEIGDAQMRAALNQPRIVVIDDSRTTVETIRRHISRVQHDHAGQLVLVVVDYIQLVAGPGRDDRERVSAAVEGLRELAKESSAVIMVVSQPSRNNDANLRNGKAVGVDAASTGAESAQLERAAYVVLSIGEVEEPVDGGPSRVMLSLAKARMGRAGQVVAMEHDGRRGVWREIGEPVTTAEHKATKTSDRADREAELLATAIPAWVEQQPEPVSREQIRGWAKRSKALVVRAIAACLAKEPPPIVEVGAKQHGAYRLWTPGKATAGGYVIHTTRSDPFPAVPEHVTEDVILAVSPPVPSSVGAGTGTGGDADRPETGAARSRRQNGRPR